MFSLRRVLLEALRRSNVCGSTSLTFIVNSQSECSSVCLLGYQQELGCGAGHSVGASSGGGKARRRTGVG
ncbi:hypothetical protein C0Q70_10585 [Pomacea canaliculata]|uniref:Uncharacterized protein n=1 Tax=Pomacea canaliculata TaxID=400727 RepID=A0A2T7P3K0_POMCA|nr:hypothetical protein C0Q70_10585 [Pomacea canaliculata]